MGSVVSAAKGTFLARSIESGNALLNSEYDNDNYPVWTSWNGVKYGSSTIRQIGVYKGLANWVHYSPLYNQGYLDRLDPQEFPSSPQVSHFCRGLSVPSYAVKT